MPPRFSRDGTLLLSIYADARCIDAVIVSRRPHASDWPVLQVTFAPTKGSGPYTFKGNAKELGVHCGGIDVAVYLDESR